MPVRSVSGPRVRRKFIPGSGMCWIPARRMFNPSPNGARLQGWNGVETLAWEGVQRLMG